MPNDFITCENKDQFHLEHLIPQLIGQTEDGEYYWRVRGCEPTGPPDYYYFDDFEQAYDANVIGYHNIAAVNILTLQDHYWNTDNEQLNTTIESLADPFFGAMKINCHGQNTPTGNAQWAGSTFNGGLFKQMRWRWYWDGAGETVDQILRMGWADISTVTDYFMLGVSQLGVMEIISGNNAVGAADLTGIAFTDGGIYDCVLTIEGTTITAEINGTAITLTNCNVRDVDTMAPYFYAENRNNLSEKALWIDYIELKHTRATI